MRIVISFTRTNKKVPRNNSIITSWFHKMLGHNKHHDNQSVYSISPLLGGTVEKDEPRYEKFNRGGYIIISTSDSELIYDILSKSIGTEIFDGMEAYKIDKIDNKFYNDQTEMFFRTTKSGLVLKSHTGNSFTTLNDENFEELLNERTLAKIKKINPNIDTTDFKIEVVEHKHNKVFNTIMKNAKIPASNVTVKISGNKDIFEMLYDLGLGNSTGCGYGHIYPTYMWRQYKKLEIQETY